MELYLLAAAIFIISIVIIELLRYAFRVYRDPDRTRIKKRLKTMATGDFTEAPEDILKKRILSDIGWLNTVLTRIVGMNWLYSIHYQANVKSPISVFLLAGAVLGVLGYAIGIAFTGSRLLPVLLIPVFFLLPILYLIYLKNQRLKKFEKQLPDGLDLIARSLRAGHGFSTGMKLASEEFEDPFGPELQACIDQINFGVSVSDALRDFASRIDVKDLKFFVVAVILQRETGGNLAEIIESIAHIIRERFRFRDKVRVLIAEGKLSMYILVALPFGVLILLFFLNKDYIMPLFDHTMGRVMSVIACVMMAVGIFIMKRMVNIKV